MKACPAKYRKLPRKLFSAALFCVLAAGNAQASKPDAVPGWVKAAATQLLPRYSPDTNAVILLDDTVYTVAPDGRATEHRRKVVRILRPQGRDEGNLYVPYDKDTKITQFHVWGIGPDGHEYALKDSDFVDIGFAGQGNLYEDLKAKAARAPARDPGGVIAYEYEQRTQPFLTEKTWFFQGNIPHLAQTFTLELPPGFTYGTVWAHHGEVKPVDLEHERWRWEIKDTPGLDMENVLLRPAELALAGRMTVHYSGPGAPFATQGTWQSIGEWYGRLSSDRLVATPDVAAKALELTTGMTDFYDKTEAVGEFVQKQIRYFVIEMGIGGYQPHFASEIYRNRYGDCKDKATLLSAMLSSVGVHSALMMVDHRRGVVDPGAPSIVGDHMIAAIEIPKGYASAKLRSVITANHGRRYLIFDPTWEKTPFGQLEHELQGSYGVLMEGPESQIVQLPILPPELNTIHREASFQMLADGSLKGQVIERRFGDLAETRRQIFTAEDENKRIEFLDHVLEQDFTTFELSGMKVENLDALNKDLTTSYRLSATGYAKVMGSLMLMRPRVLGSEGLYTDNKVRVFPIDLKESERI